MAQITWRNIDAPDFSQAGRLLEVGTRNISDAFTAGQNLIGQQQQIDLANFENARKRNTADIQNQLLGFKTPEEMAAAQAQFTPEALKARFGAAYDQSQINQLVAERPGQLRQDLTSQIQLGNLQQAEASEPYEQQFYALLAQSPGQAAKFLEQNKASFADTQQMYGDLANRQNQLDEMKFRRAQLADSAANRAEARADRQALAEEKRVASTYGQRLNQWAVDHPGESIGPEAVRLQKELGINPVTGNQVASAVIQNVSALSAPTAEQSAQLQSYLDTSGKAVTQFDEDLTTELKSRIASSGVNVDLFNALEDKKTTQDAVLDKWAARLDGDIGNATEYYNEVKEVMGDVPPAVIDKVLQDAYTNNVFTSGGAFNKWVLGDDVDTVAKRHKKALENTDGIKAVRNAQRLRERLVESAQKEASSPANEHLRKIAKANLTGSNIPQFEGTIPNYTEKRKEFIKVLDNIKAPKTTSSGYYNQK